VLAVFERQARGDLVIVTSLLASVTVPQMGAYVVGKWGQQALVRTVQQELGHRPGISVSVVAPGAVDTPIYRLAATFTGRIGRPPPPVVRPERVAAAIRRTLRHPRRRRSVGVAHDVIIAGFRFLPFVYDRLVTPLFERVAQGEDRAPTPGNVFTSDPSPAA
jgi:short-subunit dehydrogenase